MCLNASLAGLVAITASCDVTDVVGALVIGGVSGVLVVFGVWFLDNVLRVDDPVGAVAVHFVNGMWGTLAVGLFATESATAFARGYGDGKVFGANQIAAEGLFYGGGFKQLGIQFVGMITTLAWTAVTITIACFSVVDLSTGMEVNENTDLGESEYDKASEVQKNASVKVARTESIGAATGMYKVSIIAKHSRYEALKTALNELGVTGMTVTQVMGCGIQKGAGERYRGVELDVNVLPKMKVEVIVGNIPVEKVIETARKALYTGHIGDGKIFVYDVQKVVKVRTGEEDLAALNDVE